MPATGAVASGMAGLMKLAKRAYRALDFDLKWSCTSELAAAGNSRAEQCSCLFLSLSLSSLRRSAACSRLRPADATPSQRLLDPPWLGKNVHTSLHLRYVACVFCCECHSGKAYHDGQKQSHPVEHSEQPVRTFFGRNEDSGRSRPADQDRLQLLHPACSPEILQARITSGAR